MQLHLTNIGRLFLGVVVLLYFASLTSQSGLLLLLVGIVLGCFGVNLVAAWSAVKGLDLEAPQSVHLCEGHRLWQPWHLSNRTRHPAGFILGESPAGVLFRVARLVAGQEISVVPDLVYLQRGVYLHDQVEISSFYPFGLVRATRALPLAGEVVVHPALYETESPQAAGYDIMVGGKHKGQRRVASGLHFAGVRPFEPGDPLKQIHWRSSAKGQGLMVKTYEEELSGRVCFIVDSGHTGSDKTLDDCLRAAGSLMFAALDAGHHVEWMDLGGLEPRLVPPFADGHELLDALARLQAQPGCLTAERLRKAVERLPRKGAVHLVLTDFNPAVAAALEQLRDQKRRVDLCLPVDCELATRPSVPVTRYTAKSILIEA